MSIFGKNHYIKFCVMMFSWQKMAESEYYGSVQDIIYIIHDINYFCLLCLLCHENSHIFKKNNG